ncbi:unnamed protein product [marine sediment metagenome]|uniref:Transposase n=1 Tax=marine sediment metagenome TaxID=412755 RepID=X1HLA6_9ZZZZ
MGLAENRKWIRKKAHENKAQTLNRIYSHILAHIAAWLYQPEYSKEYYQKFSESRRKNAAGHY